MGGELASIHNKDQKQAIKLVADSHPKFLYFIGLQEESKNEWTWVDGSEVDYLGWDKGEPNTRYASTL